MDVLVNVKEMAESTTTYCVNHPQTETVLRCNKCGKPVCIKCVQLTPVGYRCKECIGVQRRGYYNATPFDYIIAAVVGVVLSIAAGIVMSFITGAAGLFFGALIGIFAGPAAGGVVAEAIRAGVQKRRGRYLGLIAALAMVLGGLFALLGLTVLPLLASVLSGHLALAARAGGGLLFNIGFWVYLVFSVGTAYSRLRA